MKIELLDGTVIEGYRNDQPMDTTTEVPNNITESKPFTDNAFLLLSNAKRILTDSRMFLARIPGIQSGLAYSGTGGFRCPTLGVYIEWWLSCSGAVRHECPRDWRDPKQAPPDVDTGQWLVFCLSGSPLSGSNCCGVVDINGQRRIGSLFDFLNACRAFARINSRYDEAKRTCQAYTLQQVLEICKSEGLTVNQRFIDNVFLTSKIRSLEKEVELYKRQAQAVRTEFHEYLMTSQADEIELALREFEKGQAELRCAIDQIKERRLELYRRLKAGEMTNMDYQKALHRLQIERDDTEHTLRCGCEHFNKRFFDGRVTLFEMQQFIKKRKQKTLNEVIGTLTHH